MSSLRANATTYLASLLVLTVFAVLTKTISSLAAIAFVKNPAFLNDVLLISPRSRVMLDNALLLNISTILVPALGGLL